MTDVKLTLAVGPYDHVTDLVLGRVRPTGINLSAHIYQFEEIQHRFVSYQVWDIAEMSFAKYCALISKGDTRMIALPIFPGRSFRHSSFYIRNDKSIVNVADLAGKRVGIPEWNQTAGVWARGLLAQHFGVQLSDISWVQAGVDEPGRKEQVAPNLPNGIHVKPVSDRSLDEMLVSGDIDAIITAHAPSTFLRRDPAVIRLFPDYRAEERAYYKATGIFPIMHVIVLRSDVLDGQRWIAMNLLEAFNAAKQASLDRLHEYPVPTVPLPWVAAEASEMEELFGKDYFPYGIDENRTTLTAFLEFARQQGVLDRPLTPEELFPPEVRERFRV